MGDMSCFYEHLRLVSHSSFCFAFKWCVFAAEAHLASPFGLKPIKFVVCCSENICERFWLYSHVKITKINLSFDAERKENIYLFCCRILSHKL